MIDVEGVSKYFDGVPLLSRISFRVSRGERVSLLGPGACGKSTIVKMIMGILRPEEGRITLMGQDMVGGGDAAKEKTLRDMGMAFQQGALFDYMTVEENLTFAMENMTNMTAGEMDRKITELLDTVKLPRTRRMFPHELSGGMQRRVGVARAIATNPQVAVFDEPTSGLDPVTSTIILNMINELVDISEGKSMMVVTSSVEIAIRFAERVIMVNEGRIVADGSWKELLVTGPEWVRNFLGVRLIGIDLGYARELGLPEEFIRAHWKT